MGNSETKNPTYSTETDNSCDNENNNLFILFTTSQLFEKKNNSPNKNIDEQKLPNKNIVDQKSKKRKRNQNENENPLIEKRISITRKLDNYITNITPYIKKYANKYIDNELQYNENYADKDINSALRYDDDLITKITKYEDEKDEIYVNTENFGKLIEVYIADNFYCPVCKNKTLRRYVRDNFPAVDLVCVNEKHFFDHGVKFFQVKSMIQHSLFNGKSYFSLEEKYIHVGSYKYGKIIHNIGHLEPNYYCNRKILLGYICVTIGRMSESNVSINPSKSFFVLPKINIMINKKLFNDNDIISSDDVIVSDDIQQFYKYIDNTNDYPNKDSHVIQFSENLNDIITFNEYLQRDQNSDNKFKYINMTIPRNYFNVSNYKTINNPLDLSINQLQ